MRRATAALLAAVALLALAGPATRPAQAQLGSTDYYVTALSGLYENPPSGYAVVPINSTSVPVTYGARVDFPFPFPFFGRVYDRMWVTTYGYSHFNSDTHAYSFSLPFDPSTIGAGHIADGICAPLWDFVVVQSTGRVKSWTAGTAPNRRFVVCYEDVAVNSNSSAHLYFQTKYHENGRIEFAYRTSGGVWNGTSYAIALDAPGNDPRWVTPVNTNWTNSGRPPNDYRFDPRTVLFTGRVMYDRLTPSAYGLDPTPGPAPAGGHALEIRNADGTQNSRGTTDSDGYYAISAPAGPPEGGASLSVSTQGAAAVVKAFGGSPPSWTVATGLAYTGSNVDLSTLLVDAASDPSAVFRAPANILSAIHRVRNYVVPIAVHPVPQLAVEYTPSVAGATRYVAAVGAASPSMSVAGPLATNPDIWDDAVIQRVYGRHVLASIAKPPPAGSIYSDKLDEVGDPPNAFALGFGCYLHAVVQRTSLAVDSSSPSVATVFDYETPTYNSTPGPAVPATVAAGLYELVDAANESWDWADGSTGWSIRPLQFADAMQYDPTALEFFRTWGRSGSDTMGVCRAFAHHKLIPDDVLEPNDGAGEPKPLGTVTGGGLRRDDLVLNTGSEDWFGFDLPEVVDPLCAEVIFPRTTYVATVQLQILKSTGGPLVDLTDSGSGVATAILDAAAPGTYRFRVRSVSGDIIPAYTVRVLRCLRMDRAPLKSWTQGFAYEQSIPVTGGIPPYSFAVRDGDAPPGIVFDPVTARAEGIPTVPGAYVFTLDVVDSGDPAHVDSTTHHLVVAEPLSLDFGGFVALPVGKAVDVRPPHVGGTAPLSLQLTPGGVPDGVTMSTTELRFTGAATTPGATTMEIAGRDVAGSEGSTSATAVVCVPIAGGKASAELPAHAPACGFFFDAVVGSRASVSVSTAKGGAKRSLRIVLLGPDGRVIGGAKRKNGVGKASATEIPIVVSGRYYAVVDAGDGEAATILGAAVIKPPTKGAGQFVGVVPNSFVEIPIGAIAGAKLKLTAKPDKKSKLLLSIAAVVDKNGGTLGLTDIAKRAKHGAATLSTALDVSGAWRVFVRSESGDPSAVGTVKWSWKLAQPKGVAYAEE